MNQETLLKYLYFLRNECLRYSEDKKVNENELKLFKVEVENFKTNVKTSNLNSLIKNKIESINFEMKPLVQNKGLNFFTFMLGNQFTRERQLEENLANRLRRISEEIDNTIFEIKANI